MIRIGINGFGRIGRCVVRAWLESPQLQALMQIVQINSPGPSNTAAHLLKYDTIHGVLVQDVVADESSISVHTHSIRYTRSRVLKEIRWDSVDVVLECSGKFKTQHDLEDHLHAGASFSVLSSPAKDEMKTIVFGVNHQTITSNDRVVSAASCTTNCLAPLLDALHQDFNVLSGFMTTTHAMTGDQRIIDSSHTDLCRARAASNSIIPTKTGAASSIGKVIPALKGRIDGLALRVPTLNVSVVDLVVNVAKTPTQLEVERCFEQYSLQSQHIMGINTIPLVSTDFNHRGESVIVDQSQLMITNNMIKVLAWYDNEWAFSKRMLDIAIYWGAMHGKITKDQSSTYLQQADTVAG